VQLYYLLTPITNNQVVSVKKTGESNKGNVLVSYLADGCLLPRQGSGVEPPGGVWGKAPRNWKAWQIVRL